MTYGVAGPLSLVYRLRVIGFKSTVNPAGILRDEDREYETLFGVGLMIVAAYIGREALFTSLWAIAGKITRKLLPSQQVVRTDPYTTYRMGRIMASNTTRPIVYRIQYLL